ncbi:MAG: hypothetical protein JWP04_3652, partial [Belnapia sp.]|nr:hypothetical protein [Belnapia sp.]
MPDHDSNPTLLAAATIAARFRGPPGLGNGGYVAGRMAALLGGDAYGQAAEVTLRRGWPLDVPLAIAHAGGMVEARDAEGQVVAEARPATLALEVPEPPSPAAAAAATRWFVDGPFSHSAGQCFVCGTALGAGIGLGVFSGRVEGRPGLAAALWRPDAKFAGADGMVDPLYLWSALDCAGHFAFTVDVAPGRMLLGRITGELRAPVAVGEDCIVLGWRIGAEGRKRHAGTAIFGADGGLRGLARALWVVPAP